MTDFLKERSIVLVKPDGVKRGLTGEVIKRIERCGLKIIALKMVQATPEQARDHYPGTDEWLKGMGGKTLENYEKYGKDIKADMGTDDPLEIGKQIYGWLVDFLTSGPVVAMCVEGLHAIDMVRKIVGATLPNKAEMGTIRGDFSVDSPTLANAELRAIKNIVHASGDPDEAAHEVQHWFTESELNSYKRTDEDVMFRKD